MKIEHTSGFPVGNVVKFVFLLYDQVEVLQNTLMCSPIGFILYKVKKNKKHSM